jgi:hypothetical protein
LTGLARIPWTPRLGREVLLVLAFEGNGAEVAEDRMAPLRVVENLQVLGEGSVGFGVRGPVRAVREFDLERREEALRDGVARPLFGHYPHVQTASG